MADAPLTRTCNNDACGWTGPKSDAVHPKHEPSMLLCPNCRETTDPDEMNVFDWLELEVGGMSCEYHGDPVHTHDAYWMQQQVLRLLKDAREAFPTLDAPQPPRPGTAPLSDARIYAIADGIFDYQRTEEKLPPLDRDGFRELVGSAIAQWANAGHPTTPTPKDPA